MNIHVSYSCSFFDFFLIPQSLNRFSNFLAISGAHALSGITGPMKNLIDRILIPMGEPYLGLLDGRCHHFLRDEIKHGKVVLVSNCAYWEIDNFDLVVDQMIALSNHAEREFAGALLRPHGPAFESMVDNGAAVNDILDAAKEAGRQLVQNGMMSPETLRIISRELVPLNIYVRK